MGQWNGWGDGGEWHRLYAASPCFAFPMQLVENMEPQDRMFSILKLGLSSLLHSISQYSIATKMGHKHLLFEAAEIWGYQ